MIDVSIIIVNYNTSILINNAIRSIREFTNGISYEIIVVDNATENLYDTLESSEDLDVKLLQLKQNIGFGRANNEGVKIASGRNILFLNPDTIIVNDAITQLSEYLDNHAECGACGGNLFDENMNPTRSFRRIYPTTFGMISTTFMGGLYENLKTRGIKDFNPTSYPLNVAYIVGADLMIRHNDLIKYGAFDPDFFMYYEEIELCYRLNMIGYKIVNIPSAKIQHLEGKAGAMGEKKASMHYASAQTFFKKTLSKDKYIIHNKLLKYIIKIRLLISNVLQKKDSIIYWSVWQQLYKQDYQNK